jgi:glutamine amidotransferase
MCGGFITSRGTIRDETAAARPPLIAIVDYGMGNLGSIANMLNKVGAESTVTSDPEVIASADKLILPGVGAFDNGMRELTNRGLIPVLKQEVVTRGKSMLGLCLGMQLFMSGSEEGVTAGLGWISGKAMKLAPVAESTPLKVPHMGWSTIQQCRADPLFAGLGDDARFYFVHSFHVACAESCVLARSVYGGPFVSAIRHQNIAGVQFHPEKSHRYGMQLLRNFAENF